MTEIAIHRWEFSNQNSKIMEHAEQLSGLLNQGFEFVCQTTVVNTEENGGRGESLILTTFRREKGFKVKV